MDKKLDISIEHDMPKLVHWLTEDQLRSIYTSEYWNNVNEEKKKAWWIANGNYADCLSYLHSSQLMSEYEEGEAEVKKIGRGALEVVDLAAGIGWTSALLSKLDVVSVVHAVEISKHRIGELFEHSIRMFGADPKKLRRYLGSFYETQFEDESIDLIFLSQAFHHAENPFRLLMECRRILRPGGRVLLIGEHFIRLRSVVKRFSVELLKRHKVTTNFYELFPPDPEFGDHYYRVSDYHFMFMACGMRATVRQLKSGNLMYVVEKV